MVAGKSNIACLYCTCMLRPNNQVVKVFDIRPHHRCRRTVQSYSPGAPMRAHWRNLKYDWTCASFSSPESTTQTANRSVQPFLTAHGRVSSGMHWYVLSPINCPFAWGSVFHLIHARHAGGHSGVSCAETAEPIEMPFGLWTRMGQRKYVLAGYSQSIC